MFSSLLQGSAAFLAGSFAGGIALFPGKFSVTVRIPFFDQGCATLCPGLPPSLFCGLFFLFINTAVIIEVKLLKDFRQPTIAEAALTLFFFFIVSWLWLRLRLRLRLRLWLWLWLWLWLRLRLRLWLWLWTSPFSLFT